MEVFENLWKQMSEYICLPYLLIFIFLSYLIKRHFEVLLVRITLFKWKTVYTVLLIATLLAVPFFYYTDVSWVNILFSYALGTTMYELIFEWLEKKLNI